MCLYDVTLFANVIQTAFIFRFPYQSYFIKLGGGGMTRREPEGYSILEKVV